MSCSYWERDFTRPSMRNPNVQLKDSPSARSKSHMGSTCVYSYNTSFPHKVASFTLKSSLQRVKRVSEAIDRKVLFTSSDIRTFFNSGTTAFPGLIVRFLLDSTVYNGISPFLVPMERFISLPKCPWERLFPIFVKTYSTTIV